MGIIRIDYDDKNGRNLLVRLPAGMHQRLAEAAATKGVKLGKYAIAALERQVNIDTAPEGLYFPTEYRGCPTPSPTTQPASDSSPADAGPTSDPKTPA